MKRALRIGILGGGQLARMSALAAIRMGFEVAILEKKINSPAGQLTKNEFVGWVDDKKLLKKFIKNCDVITLENEFIDYHHLEYIESLGKAVLPSSHTIKLIQDKLIQKRTLQKNNIPVPKFVEVKSADTYFSISKQLGEKFVLKSRKLGYDGYGNATIKSDVEFNLALRKLSARHLELYAEKFVLFDKELAIMVVRTKKEIITYPVVKTIQKNHICHTVIAPAQISPEVKKITNEIAVECVKSIKGFGIFGIEFFLAENQNILVNEIAPRPHNSGHYSIEGCTTSQFENHIRAVLNLPLGSADLVKPSAVMINLLGKRNGEGTIQNLSESFSDKNVHIHIYGKSESRIGRKMGHITMLGEDSTDLVKKLTKIEKKKII